MFGEIAGAFKVAAAVGALAGAVGGTAICLKRRKSDGERTWKHVSYENLIAFAQTCQRQFPNAVMSRVLCEKMEDGTYRITQLILDEKLTAIRSPKGDIVGRIFKCRQIDDKIANRCDGAYPADFDMTI